MIARAVAGDFPWWVPVLVLGVGLVLAIGSAVSLIRQERARVRREKMARLAQLALDNTDKFRRSGFDIRIDEKTSPPTLRLVKRTKEEP